MNDDQFEWEWQRLRLECQLGNVDGDAFEDLFQRIAKGLWGTDFTPTIPMGRRGDLKCDGFRASTGAVYQCYGPRYGQVNVEQAIAKVDEDFRGAEAHWGNRLKEWNFVVNVYRDKVPSELVQKVIDLSAELEVPANIIGRADLISMAAKLQEPDRFTLFGHAPGRGDMVRVTYANLGSALATIKRAITSDPLEPVVLPPDLLTKIKHNLLSVSAQHFLSLGQAGAEKVDRFLQEQVDPEEADRMAEGFKTRYQKCKNDGLEPDSIFAQMIIFAGGATGDTDRDAAALAIVSHFFAACEIFEAPPEPAQA